MNINEILRKISQCTDTEILIIIKSGVARYSALNQIQSNVELLTRKKRDRRCTSVTVFSKFNFKLSESAPSEKLGTYPKDQSLFEITNLIENVFKKVIARYKETSWVRGESKPEIHIAALKQFWLDCCVADANFLQLLQNSLPNKIWVGYSGFKKSIESTRGVSAFAIFSIKHYDKKLQKIFQIQKMLFFFCFVQMEYGVYIIRQNLVKVLTLVNIKEKTQLNIWADNLISGANKMAGSGKDYISFNEFYRYITN